MAFEFKDPSLPINVSSSLSLFLGLPFQPQPFTLLCDTLEGITFLSFQVFFETEDVFQYFNDFIDSPLLMYVLA